MLAVVVTGSNFTVVVFLPQPLAQILHLRIWWFYPLQFAPVVFFLPSTGTFTVLALGQLALRVGVFWFIVIKYGGA